MALGHPSSRNTVEACCAPEYALEVHEPRHRSFFCGLEIGRVSRRTGVSRAKDGEDHAIYDQREAGTAEVAYACRCSTCFAITCSSPAPRRAATRAPAAPAPSWSTDIGST